MKKEVILAIIAGLILGLIITAGVYTANRSINTQRAKKQLQTTPTPSLMPIPGQNKDINLTSHQPNDLLDENEILLSGVAWPKAVVALISESSTQITAADDEGIFTLNTSLIKGFNEITLIAADETGSTQTKNLILTFSTATIEPEQAYLPDLVQPAFAAEATEGAETVTEKIKERLQDTAGENLTTIKETITEKSQSPRKQAFIGRISALDSSSLTLAYKDQVYNVNLGEKTIYAKGASQLIDFADIQPGDFVIAMGFYFSQENSFEAVRVSLINEPEPKANKQLITGKINELDGQKISLNGKSLILTKKTDLTVNGLEEATIEDLALGDNLFAIVTLDGNGDINAVNDVYIMPGKNNPAGLVPTNIDATKSAE